jgi:hypothetical protein
MIEDTRQHLGKDYLSIKTEDWHLMKAFKEAVEEMGWQYNHSFTKFSTDEYARRMDDNGCMYFSYDFDDMEGKPAFALSSSQLPAYHLPQDWKSALRAAKAMLDQHRYVYSVELNEDYTAVVDIKQRTVRVGCQEFPIDKVLQIVDIFKKQIVNNK